MTIIPNATRPLDKSIMFVEDTSPEERTAHKASCHCGTVKYDVTLKYPFPKYLVNNCNCSVCFQNGYLIVYPCRRYVVFKAGYENLSSYEFNTKTRSYKFCKTCGSSIPIDFLADTRGEEDPRKDILAVNVRHFKDIDLDALEYTTFDGRSLL